MLLSPYFACCSCKITFKGSAITTTGNSLVVILTKYGNTSNMRDLPKPVANTASRYCSFDLN